MDTKTLNKGDVVFDREHNLSHTVLSVMHHAVTIERDGDSYGGTGDGPETIPIDEFSQDYSTTLKPKFKAGDTIVTYSPNGEPDYMTIKEILLDESESYGIYVVEVKGDGCTDSQVVGPDGDTHDAICFQDAHIWFELDRSA